MRLVGLVCYALLLLMLQFKNAGDLVPPDFPMSASDRVVLSALELRCYDR